jgi:arsenate-mycothiol transferase
VTQEPPDLQKTPAVLLACSKNGGKSQLASGLVKQLAGTAVTVYSAGTNQGSLGNR